MKDAIKDTPYCCQICVQSCDRVVVSLYYIPHWHDILVWPNTYTGYISQKSFCVILDPEES